MGLGVEVRLVQTLGHGRVQGVIDQGRLARAGHPRHTGHQADGDVNRDAFEVVSTGVVQLQARGLRVKHPAFGGHLDAQRPTEVASGEAVGIVGDVLRRTLGEHAPTMHTSARPHVHHVIGGTDHVFVVLDDEHAVAQVAQVLEGADESVVVALVQPDAGLIEHIHHARQARANLAGQADALRLAPGEGFGAAIQAEVVQAHVIEKAQA